MKKKNNWLLFGLLFLLGIAWLFLLGIGAVVDLFDISSLSGRVQDALQTVLLLISSTVSFIIGRKG